MNAIILHKLKRQIHIRIRNNATKQSAPERALPLARHLPVDIPPVTGKQSLQRSGVAFGRSLGLQARQLGLQIRAKTIIINRRDAALHKDIIQLVDFFTNRPNATLGYVRRGCLNLTDVGNILSHLALDIIEQPGFDIGLIKRTREIAALLHVALLATVIMILVAIRGILLIHASARTTAKRAEDQTGEQKHVPIFTNTNIPRDKLLVEIILGLRKIRLGKIRVPTVRTGVNRVLEQAIIHLVAT